MVPRPSPLCRGAKCAYASASTVSATRHQGLPTRRARSRASMTPGGTRDDAGSAPDSIEERRRRGVHGLCLESIENGPHPADAPTASTRREHLPRPADVLGIVDFVLCPSQEFVEGANGLESSLIDRLLGQRFQEDAAEFAHDPSLIDLGASSYASTAQNRGPSVAVSRQRVSRANGPRVGPGRRPASVAIRALVVVVGAALTALPRRLPGIGGVAQLTLAQFVQAILLRARQLKIAGTLGCIDVDRIGRIRRRRIGRSRAGPTEKSLQEAHRQRLCHADGRALGGS